MVRHAVKYVLVPGLIDRNEQSTQRTVAAVLGPVQVDFQGPNRDSRTSASSGPAMCDNGLMQIDGDGFSSDWFFTKNSGRKFKRKERSHSCEIAEGKRPRTSLALRPEASKTRKTVF